MRFYSPHDVQLRVVFITGALQQGFFFFFPRYPLLLLPPLLSAQTAGHQFKTKTWIMYKSKGRVRKKKKSHPYWQRLVC